MAVFSPLAGRLSDRIEPRIIASFGMALTCVGLFALACVDAGNAEQYAALMNRAYRSGFKGGYRKARRGGA